MSVRAGQRSAGAVLAAVALALLPCEGAADGTRWFASSEADLAFLGQIASGEPALGAAAYRVAAGFRHGPLDVFFSVEHGFWRGGEGSRGLSVQALGVGVGFGASYFGGRLRSEIAAGPSILLTRSQLDEAGTTGLFVDVRPAGYRWRFCRRGGVSVYPLTLPFVAPVIEGTPLVYVSYRTVLAFDLEF
jgi:hypothetical protein